MALDQLANPFGLDNIRIQGDPPDRGERTAKALSRSLRSTAPERMNLPEGGDILVGEWPEVLVKFVQWLASVKNVAEFVQIGISESEKVGVTLSRRLSPIKPQEGTLRGRPIPLSNGWWLDGGIAAQQQDMWLTMRYLADHFGIDSSKVRIWYHQS